MYKRQKNKNYKDEEDSCNTLILKKFLKVALTLNVITFTNMNINCIFIKNQKT